MEDTIFSTLLFSKLDPSEIEILKGLVQQKHLSAGAVLCEEGEASDELFFIQSGSLEVLKKGIDHQMYVIKTLGAGDLVGEFSLLENKPRSATLRAVGDVELQSVVIQQLKANEKIFAKVQIGLNLLFAERLHHTNEVVVESMRKELISKQTLIEIGRFSIICILLVCLYSFTLRIVTLFFPETRTTFVTVPIILVYAFLFALFAKSCRYPISYFGITRKNFARSLRIGFFSTLPFLALMFGVKMGGAYMAGTPIEEVFKGWQFLWTKTGAIVAVVYVLLCPLQEFIARGICQTSFTNFIAGDNITRHWKANLLANSVFTVAHLHYPFPLPILVFATGMLWGWIYSKEPNLAGASLSHIMIGFCGQFILKFT